jgi:hypothetical protein
MWISRTFKAISKAPRRDQSKNSRGSGSAGGSSGMPSGEEVSRAKLVGAKLAHHARQITFQRPTRAPLHPPLREGCWIKWNPPYWPRQDAAGYRVRQPGNFASYSLIKISVHLHGSPLALINSSVWPARWIPFKIAGKKLQHLGSLCRGCRVDRLCSPPRCVVI